MESDQLADEFRKTLTLEHAVALENDDDDEDKDGIDSSDFEFSFTGAGDVASSPVSAEDVFHNGQIRPTFPFSSDKATTSYGPPVRKLFVKSSPERDDIAEGPYCAWSSSENSKPPAPAMSKKSNSTGFSKLWRFRDLLVRSNSDGKDAFVFLTEKSPEIASEKKKEKREKIKVEVKKKKKKGGETTTPREKKEKSVYEVLYGKREKEKKAGKGKSSYLPYKVGFFTNVNGSMSRNVHPY